jgi:hypothetical protein
MCSIAVISWRSMTERVEANCLNWPAVMTFDNQPGYTTCMGCEAKLYLTSSGQLGVVPGKGWKPGGFGGSDESGHEPQVHRGFLQALVT